MSTHIDESMNIRPAHEAFLPLQKPGELQDAISVRKSSHDSISSWGWEQEWPLYFTSSTPQPLTTSKVEDSYPHASKDTLVSGTGPTEMRNNDSLAIPQSVSNSQGSYVKVAGLDDPAVYVKMPHLSEMPNGLPAGIFQYLPPEHNAERLKEDVKKSIERGDLHRKSIQSQLKMAPKAILAAFARLAAEASDWLRDRVSEFMRPLTKWAAKAANSVGSFIADTLVSAGKSVASWTNQIVSWCRDLYAIFVK